MKQLILGKNNNQSEYEAESLTAMITKTIVDSQQSLSIYSDNFDPELFNHQALADALSEFIRQSRYRQCKLLVREPSNLIKRFHYIAERSQRIPTRLPLKRDQNDSPPDYQLLIISDDNSYIAIDRNDNGIVNSSTDDRVSNKKLKESFDLRWHSALDIAELKTLS
jgi:hypothetical protein